MSWNKIGGPAHSLAIYANRLAALTPDRQAVYMRDPSTGSWTQIGGAFASLIGGGWDLYAVAVGTGDIWRYDGKSWFKVGGPGAQFVGICNALYALSTDSAKLYRFDRYSGTWTEIGGAAHSIIGGGSKVYASSPGKDGIWEYSRYQGNWTKIGGHGAMWVGVGETVYGLTPGKDGVYRYNGTPGNWTKIGGAAGSLIGGGSFLYATPPGAGSLWRYSGKGEQWDDMGTLGAQFVGVGHTLYRLTTDKSEVYEFNDDNAESKRLRSLLYNAYDKTEFGNRVTRGFVVKRMGGEVLAEHCSDVCFQPLSTLKLLPYLHTLIEVDKGSATLSGTKVSWVQPTNGTPLEKADQTCLAPGSPGTQPGTAKLADALPTMMWESHNRTLDSLLNKYGPANITARAQQLGLRQTEMYSGCPQPGGAEKPWTNNVSTLIEIARIFEGVDSLEFVTATSTRTAFLKNMIVLEAAPGTSYTSPITGNTRGPFSNELVRPLVEQEAGAAKQASVAEFMTHVVLHGKGGGGGPNGEEVSYSDFLQVSLPFKKNGAIVIRNFLVGWYVCQLRGGPESASVQQSEDEALATFRQEIHRLPIRLALETW